MFKSEQKIVKRVIADLLAAGYEIAVSDGKEMVLKPSTDAKAIFAVMGTTDEDKLFTYSLINAKQPRSSFVYFVYGNGPDVICDYGESLDPVMAPILTWTETL